MDVSFSKTSKEYEEWATLYYVVKVPQGKVGQFLQRMDKVKRDGSNKYDDEQKRLRKIDFLQKRMRPIDPNITGENYEESKSALFKAIFDEDL